MLVEIRSDLFNDKVVKFHNGLNVVLGDERATNSIGKSSLLMVIDFIFGGTSFIEHNKDVVNELGHHEYFYSFNFDNEYYYFKRGTYTPDIVYNCSKDYSTINGISVEEYTALLKSLYKVSSPFISFRALVGTFSRIWGKKNLDVNRPLHIIPNVRASDCVNNLIKMFNKFDSIHDLLTKLKSRSEEKTTYSKAQKTNIIPKINKKQFLHNIDQISNMEKEIDEIKENLALFAININEIANKETLELKEEKDNLLSIQHKLNGKLRRIQHNISENKFIKSKNLKSLLEFFPSANIEKLDNIESFHDGLTRILKNELIQAKNDLLSQFSIVSEELDSINNKISQSLSNLENPTFIVDRVHELSKNLQKLKIENMYYEDQIEVTATVKELKLNLIDITSNILKFIEDLINDNIFKIVKSVYQEPRKSPTLDLSLKNYKYHVYEDTGTGKAYSNLLIFDIAIFELTDLPILIHDSVLFKNIENNAVTGLVKLYLSYNKQSFISLDEIAKYGEEATEILHTNYVIKLSNEKQLYIKDWRK